MLNVPKGRDEEEEKEDRKDAIKQGTKNERGEGKRAEPSFEGISQNEEGKTEEVKGKERKEQ